jgi:hypothetical protein
MVLESTTPSTMPMFHPSTVASHKMRLQYSEETREKQSAPKNRTNHGSFPSFRESVDGMAEALMGEKANTASTAEKLAKLSELPTVQTPESLPGDCPVKDYVLENVTPCKSSSLAF